MMSSMGEVDKISVRQLSTEGDLMSQSLHTTSEWMEFWQMRAGSRLTKSEAFTETFTFSK